MRVLGMEKIVWFDSVIFNKFNTKRECRIAWNHNSLYYHDTKRYEESTTQDELKEHN